ncbi:MAG TPA: CofH family radical SAM protein [Salinivirgaceae bacterium]|mgnify:CR=1 FL=1|nr:CofH family radical SAM protein [Salinivirgaceae bacterium]
MKKLHEIIQSVEAGDRIEPEDAKMLFQEASLGQMAELADRVNQRINGKKVYFIRNIHIEPTNICRNRCGFCSYRKSAGEPGAYVLSVEEILSKIEAAFDISEVHIVGGLNSDLQLSFYCSLFEQIRSRFPNIFRKGLTAEEIHFLSGGDPMRYSEVLKKLINSGLQAMPGGGAEIFKQSIREKICPDKLSGDQWLLIHKTAHLLGISTNATILYGHIETLDDRIDHLWKIRQLQDETKGFNAFIPLKYKLSENSLGLTREVPLMEDLRMFAISRIFLDNVPHIKTYWPMLGFENALLMLSFGADDLDGTVAQSTGIYNQTGNIGKSGRSVDELVTAIRAEGKIPVERDSLYREIKVY